MPDPVIRLDRSRKDKISTVHGDRAATDPAYYVHFYQDGLPFDAKGELVPDDGKTEPWSVMVEGELIRHQPLYDDKMRAAVAEKLKKLKSSAPKAKQERAPDEKSGATKAADDVNFVSWLRGEVEYEWQPLTNAYAERFGIRCSNKRALIEDAVFDRKIVPEADVAPALLAYVALQPA